MRSFFLVTLVLLLFIAGCEGLPTDLERGQFQSPPPQQPDLTPPSEGYSEGRIVIQPTPTSSESGKDGVLQPSSKESQEPTPEIEPQTKTTTTGTGYSFPWEWIIWIILATTIGFFGGVAVGVDFAENCKNRQ